MATGKDINRLTLNFNKISRILVTSSVTDDCNVIPEINKIKIIYTCTCTCTYMYTYIIIFKYNKKQVERRIRRLGFKLIHVHVHCTVLSLTSDR